MRPIDPSWENSTDNAITVASALRHSSSATPFYLKDKTERTHVYFKPEIVENSKDPANCVKGNLVDERKKPTEKSFPTECGEQTITKASISSHGALSIALSTGETRELYDGLRRMYSLSGVLGWHALRQDELH